MIKMKCVKMLLEEVMGDKKNTKERFILFSGFTFAFLVFICQIRENGMLYLSTDEFGQWATAAWMAGRDWSPIASRNVYYSYFYALPLSLFFRMFESPFTMYRAATVMNAVMLSSIVFMAFFICKKICKKSSPWMLGIIALNCTLFSSNIIMANLTWSESMLITVSWLVLFLVVKLYLSEKTTTKTIVALACALMIGYMTHQRFLGVLISGIAMICLAKIIKKISWRQLGIFFIFILFLVIVHRCMKFNVQNAVFGIQAGQEVGSDYSGQIDKLLYLFSLKGVVTFFRIVVGQLYYIGVSSGFLGYLGIIYLVKRIKELKTDGAFCIYVFIALAILSTMMIGSVFLISAWRIDHVIYGRYNEMVLGFLILLGWCEVRESRSMKEVVGIVAIGFLVSLISRNSITSLGVTDAIQSVCIGGIAMLWQKNLGILGIYAVAIVLFFCIAVLERRKKAYFHFLGGILVTLFFITSGLYVNKNIVLPTKIKWREMESILDISGEDSSVGYKWLWVDDKEVPEENKLFSVNVMPPLLQFLLKDEVLYYVDESEWESSDWPNTHVITNIFPLYLPQYHVEKNIENVFLLTSKADSADKIYSLPLEWFFSQSSQEEEFRSFGKNEALLYGPYMTLRPGKYNFEIDLNVFGEEENLGNVDVVSGSTVLYQKNILKSELVKENNVLKVPINVLETWPRFELRIITAENADLQIKKIDVTYENEGGIHK